MTNRVDDAVSYRRCTRARYFTLAVQVTPKLPPGIHLLPLPADDGSAGRRPRASTLRHGGAWNASAPQLTRPAWPSVAALTDPSPYRGDVAALFTLNHGASNRPRGVPLSADPGLAVAYAYSDVPTTVEAVRARAAAQLDGSKRRVEVRKSYEFIYYPRVSQAELQGGWMERMDALQGRRGVYHAGGLLTFWVRRCGCTARDAAFTAVRH